MQMKSIATTGGTGLMAPDEQIQHASGGAGSRAATEPSLADGTGEGNAPIDGTSASSDPEILAGTGKEDSATSLNDDDYPDNIADAAGASDDGTDGLGGSDGGAGAASESAGNDENTAGATRMPDEAAGVDLGNWTARPGGAAG